MMVNRQDVQLLLRLGRSLGATAHGLKLVLRYAVDRLRHGRGTRLVLGSALVGRLAATVFDLGIPLFLSCPATELIHDTGGNIIGVVAILCHAHEGNPATRRSKQMPTSLLNGLRRFEEGKACMAYPLHGAMAIISLELVSRSDT